MRTTQEILALTNAGVTTAGYAQRQADERTLEEMNIVAEAIAENELVIPRGPFLFAMLGEWPQRPKFTSPTNQRMANVAGEFSHGRKHTAFASTFPPDEVFMFDESSEADFREDPKLAETEILSAARYRIEKKEGGKYLGKIVVPTFAVFNFADVIQGAEAEVTPTLYTALVVARKSSSIRHEIERIDRPVFNKEIDYRIRLGGSSQGPMASALSSAVHAIQSHPDYQRSE